MVLPYSPRCSVRPQAREPAARHRPGENAGDEAEEIGGLCPRGNVRNDAAIELLLAFFAARVHLDRSGDDIAGDAGHRARPPVADDAGDRLAVDRRRHGADGDAAARLALHADAEFAARCAQRIEEIAERRPLQGVVETADGNALPQPIAPARLARRLGMQDDEIDVVVGRGARQIGELDALLAAARRAEMQEVVLDAAGDEHRLPAHRRHGGGERRRIDGIDQGRLGLRIDARRRRKRPADRPAPAPACGCSSG